MALSLGFLEDVSTHLRQDLPHVRLRLGAARVPPRPDSRHPRWQDPRESGQTAQGDPHRAGQDSGGKLVGRGRPSVRLGPDHGGGPGRRGQRGAWSPICCRGWGARCRAIGSGSPTVSSATRCRSGDSWPKTAIMSSCAGRPDLVPRRCETAGRDGARRPRTGRDPGVGLAGGRIEQTASLLAADHADPPRRRAVVLMTDLVSMRAVSRRGTPGCLPWRGGGSSAFFSRSPRSSRLEHLIGSTGPGDDLPGGLLPDPVQPDPGRAGLHRLGSPGGPPGGGAFRRALYDVRRQLIAVYELVSVPDVLAAVDRTWGREELRAWLGPRWGGCGPSVGRRR